jgi:hypothetical protein
MVLTKMAATILGEMFDLSNGVTQVAAEIFEET